jgi:hypothetical protein
VASKWSRNGYLGCEVDLVELAHEEDHLE